MDKNAIKKFAVWARRELIARVSQKAEQYGITEKHIGDLRAESVDGRLLTPVETVQRDALIHHIRQNGYQQVMEEVAYTWFNRFCALRFMEVNNYLPTRIRVFTDEANAFKPQILTEAIHMEMDGLNMDKVYQLKSESKTEELYKYMLITQCNALNSILPGMFQRIADYTELLLPDNLLREGSVIEQMIALIPEADWKDAVEIIGWFYQYYNTEVFASLYDGDKATAKITDADMPAATQLFTPDWIVKYMVENSLGQIWEGAENNETLKTKWMYLLESPAFLAHHTKNIHKEKSSRINNPVEIKCIDPCMGSGHILVCLFDSLISIYETCGYSTREAVQSIIENNLYGLDIDDRAAQLAYFAVMMKARQHDRRFFTRDIHPHVCSIQESSKMPEEAWSYFGAEQDIARRVFAAFVDAKEYGSLIEPNVTVEELDALDARLAKMNSVASYGNLAIKALVETALNVMCPLMKQARMLVQKYDVIVTNPPYLNANRMDAKLSSYVGTEYKESKQDLYSVFLHAAIRRYAKKEGCIAFITPTSWMHSEKFKKLRSIIVETKQIVSLVDCGTELFDGKVGHLFIAAYVIRNAVPNHQGLFVDLTEFCYSRRGEKQKQYLNGVNRGVFDQRRFSLLPDKPIAYKTSDTMYDHFERGYCLEQEGSARQGLTTSDNTRFTRLWHEVSPRSISFACNSCDQTIGNVRWYPFLKGGDFQRWYQRFDTVVNYQNDGQEIKATVMQKYPYLNNPGFVVKNTDWYFRAGITWNDVAGERFNARLMPQGYIFADASPAYFPQKGELWYYLAYFNSVVFQNFADVICKGLHYSTGQIPKIPLCKYGLIQDVDIICNYAKHNYEIMQKAAEYCEEKIDFSEHPLIFKAKALSRGAFDSITIEESYRAWEEECEVRVQTIKFNEEEINRIFIDIYGLQDELTPEVEDKDVTVRKADLGRDIRSLISYAVGCIFGRYSLSKPGLAFAGGEWDGSNYTSEFQPDKDGILPISDDDYFNDDIVARFVRFVEVVYGKKTLEENLAFIAKALGGNGTPRDVIRNYFLNDFYADHLKIYQKRPIYWLFDSGKKNGFKALIYMHRYAPDTIARIRTDYVHEQQSRYRTAIADLENRIVSASTSERVKLNKQLAKVKAQDEELRLYEEKIHHLADQMISIDLDDGVKVNYAKFADVLAKIK